MTTTQGTLLGVEETVSGAYDVGKGQGYQVEDSMTVDGTPTEASVRDGVWKAIEEAGDLPIYVRVKLTYAGHVWPWLGDVSKFDVKYQAVHLAEGTTLLAIAGLIWALLPLVLEFIFILLKVGVITYAVIWAIEVSQWVADQGPAVAAGVGAGVVVLAALILMGGNKK